MVDDIKEWDIAKDDTSTRTSSVDPDPELSQPIERDEAYYLRLLPKDQSKALLLLLWRPEVHGHMRDSVVDSVVALENKHGCRLSATLGYLRKMTSSTSLSQPLRAPTSTQTTLVVQQPLPHLQSSGLPKRK